MTPLSLHCGGSPRRRTVRRGCHCRHRKPKPVHLWQDSSGAGRCNRRSARDAESPQCTPLTEHHPTNTSAAAHTTGHRRQELPTMQSPVPATIDRAPTARGRPTDTKPRDTKRLTTSSGRLTHLFLAVSISHVETEGCNEASRMPEDKFRQHAPAPATTAPRRWNSP